MRVIVVLFLLLLPTLTKAQSTLVKVVFREVCQVVDAENLTEIVYFRTRMYNGSFRKVIEKPSTFIVHYADRSDTLYIEPTLDQHTKLTFVMPRESVRILPATDYYNGKYTY
jgi:hypothetical protein